MTATQSTPEEFDPANVRSNAAPEDRMYHSEVSSQEPMASVLASNPEIYFVPPKRSSE